ncbi:MAG: hypothetical protein Q8S13_07240, partial [Dehalococcoidia bacterium]|nr:hypothetical protein [Dehalococcoidia bacterium]
MTGFVVRVVLLAFVVLAVASADAGHESPFYPSFYPQEITIQRVEPSSAAALLQRSAIHAYVGGDLFPSVAAPVSVSAAESLGSYVVLTFNPGAQGVADGRARCLAARSVLSALAKSKAPYVFHPYPVTPYHEDYLGHVDLIA